MLDNSPGIFAIGNQPSFAADLVTDEEGGLGTRTRVVLVPRFSTTGEIVLVHSGSLAVKTMKFGVATSGWNNSNGMEL